MSTAARAPCSSVDGSKLGTYRRTMIVAFVVILSVLSVVYVSQQKNSPESIEIPRRSLRSNIETTHNLSTHNNRIHFLILKFIKHRSIIWSCSSRIIAYNYSSFVVVHLSIYILMPFIVKLNDLIIRANEY